MIHALAISIHPSTGNSLGGGSSSLLIGIIIGMVLIIWLNKR